MGSTNDEHIIAPIAIDVGAAHTGVFRAIYPQGTGVGNINERYGEVLTLDSSNYTLLMRDRTAKRHMRRGFDRRKLAKRLLALVLRHYFDFPAHEHRQALGFFMNRRGFTFLEESFDAEALEDFPNEAWEELPKPAQSLLLACGQVKEQIGQLIENDPEAIKKLHQTLIEGTIQTVKNRLFVLKYAKKLTEAADKRCSGEDIKEADKEKTKLSQTPSWVVDRLIKDGADILKPYRADNKNTDLLTMLNQANAPELAALITPLQATQDKLKAETDTVWKKVKLDRFDPEKNRDKLTNEETAVEAHLSNLVYAIHRANQELASGSRHRRKYFEEIKSDIANAANHSHTYMQRFAEAIQASSTLDEDKFYRIITHISNLELKPLRACFNDKAHRQGDQWQPENLAKIVSRWFLKQWRVSKENDSQQKVTQYQQLKQAWADHTQPEDMVAFWLATDPEWTIPPYQSQTNRRPPDCQSLILNPDYMNHHYPGWQDWLTALDTGLAPDLTGVTRRKDDKPLANENQRKLRQLQFLLDRAQKADRYRLNLIWSQYHRCQKYRNESQEYQEAGLTLKQHIADSTLPDALKQTLRHNFNALEQGGGQKTFAHFINQYYQSRRKARDGRYFLHPLPANPKIKCKPGERRPRWDDQNKLLTLCLHRPRQKRHQMHMDFAAIVGMTPGELKQRLQDQSVESLLSDIYRFRANAENAAKAQKEHRGELKLKLQQGKNKKLNKLAARVEQLAIVLAKHLWPKLDEAAQNEKARRFNTLFSFAQIHNIVFKDRSGFSNTCPVCSTDNAGRMVDDDDKNALASRLPALSVRLIDGAVKRLLDRKAEDIARRHWRAIEPRLQKGRAVCVPLILEQNRFEFEPSLAKLKGKKPRNPDMQEAEPFDTKTNRIRSASKGLCPYSGNALTDSGELDHIIPRASVYGTLNDEANLIHVSRAANRTRSNQKYFINNLNSQYKVDQFPTCADDQAIKQWIYQTLTEKPVDENAPFVFGHYMSFINLEDDQQTAFRHALFLDDDDPLKKRVTNALQNRNRTFVNGTQRYFAQLIADKLHSRARKAKLPGKLSFDYFEYPADPRHPKGVQNLRNALGIKKQEIQEDYSHHVDAHMAFLLAIDDHRGDGSLGVDFGNITSVWPFDDGDISAYMATRLDATKVESIALKRKASATGNRPHRQYHRDNFYADHYLPLWLIPNETGTTTKKGFSTDNSVELNLSKKSMEAALESVAHFASNENIRNTARGSDDWDAFATKLLEQSKNQPVYIAWSRKAIEQHCVEHFSAKSLAEGKAYSTTVTFLRDLACQTQKKKIDKPEAITEALAIKNNKGETLKGGVYLPARKEWQHLQDAWKANAEPEGEAFQTFLKNWFLNRSQSATKDNNPDPKHKKIRQVFSLPIYNENAHYLQARQDLYGEPVFQLIADSDSRKDGNKFKRAALGSDGKLIEVVNPAFASPRMFKLKQDKVYSKADYRNIDPNRWHELTKEQAEQAELPFPRQVIKIAYLIDNVTRPKIKVTIDWNGSASEQDDHSKFIKELFAHALTKPKDKDKLRQTIPEKDTQCFTTAPYIGSGFNTAIKQAMAILLNPHE